MKKVGEAPKKHHPGLAHLFEDPASPIGQQPTASGKHEAGLAVASGPKRFYSPSSVNRAWFACGLTGLTPP